MGSLASSIGAVDVGVVYVDVEGGALAGAAVSFGISPNGGSASKQVPVAPNTPDLAAAYAAASDGVAALAIALTTADEIGSASVGKRVSVRVDLVGRRINK